MRVAQMARFCLERPLHGFPLRKVSFGRVQNLNSLRSVKSGNQTRPVVVGMLMSA